MVRLHHCTLLATWLCVSIQQTLAIAEPEPEALYFENTSGAGNHTLIPAVNVLDRRNISLLIPNTTITLDYVEEKPENNKTYVSQLLVKSTIPMFVPENSVDISLYCENTTSSAGDVNQIHFEALSAPVFDTITQYLARSPLLELITITNHWEGGCNPEDTRGLFSVSNYSIGVKCPTCFSFGVVPVDFQDFASSIQVTYGIVNGSSGAQLPRPSILASDLYKPVYDVCPTALIQTQVVTVPVQTVTVDNSGRAVPTSTIFVPDPNTQNTTPGTPQTVYVIIDASGSTIIDPPPVASATTIYQTINSLGVVVQQSIGISVGVSLVTPTDLPSIFTDPTPYEVELENNYNCNSDCQAIVRAKLDSIGFLTSTEWYERIARGLDLNIARPADGVDPDDKLTFALPEGYTFYDVPSSYFVTQNDQLSKRDFFDDPLGTIGGVVDTVGDSANKGLDATKQFFTKTIPETFGGASGGSSGGDSTTGNFGQTVINFFRNLNSVPDGINSFLQNTGNAIESEYNNFPSQLQNIGQYLQGLLPSPTVYKYNHRYPFDARPGENTLTSFGRPGFHIPGFPQALGSDNRAEGSKVGSAQSGGLNGGFYLDAYCLQCSFIGNADVTGTFFIDLAAGNIGDITFDVSLSGSIRLEIGLELIGQVTYNFTQPFVSVGLPGFTVPNVVVVGPQILGEVGVSVYSAASVQVAAGVIINFGNARTRINAQDINKSGGEQFQPAVELIPPTVSGQGRLVINPFTRVSLQFGISVLGNKLTAAVGVAVQAGVGFQASGRYDISSNGLAAAGQCVLDNVPPTAAQVGNRISSFLQDITKPSFLLQDGTRVTGNGIFDVPRLRSRDATQEHSMPEEDDDDDHEPDLTRRQIDPKRISVPIPSLSLQNPQATGLAYPIGASDYCSNGIQLSSYLEVTVYVYAAVGFVRTVFPLNVVRKIVNLAGTQQFTLWQRIYPIAVKCIQLPASISTTLCDTQAPRSTPAPLSPSPRVRNRVAVAAGSATGTATGTIAPSTSSASSTSSTSGSVSSQSSASSSSSATSLSSTRSSSSSSSTLSTSMTSASVTSTGSTSASSLGISTTSATSASLSSPASTSTSTSSSSSSSSSSPITTTTTLPTPDCTIVAAGTPSTIKPAASPTVTYSYIGCFNNRQNAIRNEINGQPSDPQNTLGRTPSLAECVNQCMQQGRRTAGYQGGDCFCSSTTPDSLRLLNNNRCTNTNCGGLCDTLEPTCSEQVNAVIYYIL